MSETKNNGGPAFPVPMGSDWPKCDTGMTLRDYFAGQALTLAHKFLDDGWCGDREVTGENIAEIAYQIADDMIAARL